MYFIMKHIELNIIQFLILIIFIYVFTFFWLPKTSIQKTPEYKKLINKYINLLDEKEHWYSLYTQCVTNYNINKSSDEEPLERLNRYDGGFKINLSFMKDKICDDNEKIRQLRWNKGRLVSFPYIDFTEKQTRLLYDSIAYALKGNVILEN